MPPAAWLLPSTTSAILVPTAEDKGWGSRKEVEGDNSLEHQRLVPSYGPVLSWDLEEENRLTTPP